MTSRFKLSIPAQSSPRMSLAIVDARMWKKGYKTLHEFITEKVYEENRKMTLSEREKAVRTTTSIIILPFAPAKLLPPNVYTS